MRQLKQLSAVLILSSAVCVASANAPVSKKLANGAIIPSTSVASVQREVREEGKTITVSYSIPEAKVIPVGTTGLMKCTLEDFSTVEDPELPALPVRYDAFEIPEGYDATVSLISSNAATYNVEIASVTPITSSSKSEAVISKAVTKGVYPASVAGFDRIETYRGHDILCVKVSPVNYDSSTASLSVAHDLTYKVTFTPKKAAALSPRKIVSEQQELSDRVFLNSIVLNPQPIYPKYNPEKVYWDYAPKMLIVTRSKYSSALNRLVEWKKLLGYNVEVLASVSALTPQQIRTYTMNNKDAVALLIVGDEKDVSTNVIYNYRYWDGKSKMSTDMLYACTDSESDRMPDMIYGRITVSTVSELNEVVDKILGYERNPPSLSSFYDNVGLLTQFVDNDKYHPDKDGVINHDGIEDNDFIQNSEKMRTTFKSSGKNPVRLYSAVGESNPLYYSDGSPLPEELLRSSGFNWDNNEAKTNQFLNDGAFLLILSVHGAPTQFEKPDYDVSSIRNLNNGNLLPVVFGMSCELGAFNGHEEWEKTEDTFAETFLKHANGGTVGILAASREAYDPNCDYICKFLIKELYPPLLMFGQEDTYPEELKPYRYTNKMGNIIRNSLIQNNLKYSDIGKDGKFHLMVFHYFGDPTTRIYTREPETATCQLGLTTPGSNSMVFNYTPGATFTIVNNKTGEVLTSTGFSSQTYYLPVGCTGDNLSYCVSGPNLRPYYVIGSPSSSAMSEGEDKIESCVTSESNLEISVVVDDSHSQSAEILVSPTLMGESRRISCADSNKVQVENLKSGVYVVALVIDGAVIDTKKVVIK